MATLKICKAELWVGRTMAALPNKIAYLTGASRGIGRALTDKLLETGYHVIGISRSECKPRANFTAIQLDLNDIDAVQSFDFKHLATDVLLVNNAGLIGEIGPVGQVSNQTIRQVMTVNTIAPQILMNNFLKTFQGQVKNGHILNISSGAGKNAIDAWAAYCASKSALDLFSESIQLELKLRDQLNWWIHSVAPGVVDTQMQDEIRQANPDKFKVIDKFRALKENNELSDPKHVANKLFQIIENPEAFPNTVISVRDF